MLFTNSCINAHTTIHNVNIFVVFVRVYAGHHAQTAAHTQAERAVSVSITNTHTHTHTHTHMCARTHT